MTAGSREVLGVFEGSPVLTVDLGPDADVGTPVPPWLPAVVVGVAGGAPNRPAPLGVDVALCRAARHEVAPGWVAVDDPAAELERLTTRVNSAAQPAVVLVQLLRLATGRDTDAALVAESLAYSTLQAGPMFAAWLGRRPTAGSGRPELEEVVGVERRGERLVVTLRRPHVRNALNTAMRDALVEALTVAALDLSVGQVELRGEGSAFCSGGDLEEFGTAPDPVAAHLARTERSPARMLAALGSRVTAHLHGPCVGAGIELAAFAGTVVAAPGTRCQLPEVALGLVPGSGGTVSIPRRIGRHRTAWMGITGSAVDVEVARAWGLVDAVVAEG